jgi:mannose-6-phosphate isomerase-like protein (cupin superfamily)
MNLNFAADTDVVSVINEIVGQLSSAIRVRTIDSSRPWGGFLVIEEEDIDVFIYQFFPQLNKEDLGKGKLSPKILIVAPGKKLSWQYHHRRAEIWKVIGGQAGIVTSNSDIQGEKQVLQTGELIELKQGERHRLIGLQEWGIVAEIWKHTDDNHPSDEEDIVRVEDDFGR